MTNAKTSIEDRFGLKQHTISAISNVFARYSEIKQAVLYGSRAKGTYRNGSDIDLTLCGEALTYNQLERIETEIDDLLLPYAVDLSLYTHIDNADLLEHIQRVGQVFYQREQL
ncbi:nucleotidyltransferase domain-containing protein [Methylomonas sp. AM2-LC]|uniref:nucleotidyltransferase domain-containing protein n=1 Tax=Methylomonas sp. AM2-LC TaxID=3153301 RepID=UPI00326529C3